MRLFNCPRPSGFEVNDAPTSIAESIIGSAECPGLHASSWPGHFDDIPGASDYSGDYVYYDPAEEEEMDLDYFSYDDYTPQFRAVATPDELQAALRAGTKHVLILSHLDMTASQSEPDLPQNFEALNDAIGRVSNTTLSIAGWCEELPPEYFGLTEPVPPGACAILVREDFLDAPLGTTCLLLDSLYIVAAKPRSGNSSVLVLHVDGLMWITNCVFQGAGRHGRAIDTNTKNGGTPELYVKDTTFVGFTRNAAPGIRALENATLWLDNVTFRDMERTARHRPEPEGSAVVAYDNVLLVLMDVTIEDNIVLGEPAGNKAVTIAPNTTEVYASPPAELWQWHDGPPLLTDADTSIAEFIIQSLARPQLATIQSIQLEIILRELSRDSR